MFVAARPSLLRALGTSPALRIAAMRAPLSMAQRRSVQTSSMTELEELKLLQQQRLNRPNSPHLQIYQPQLTWYASGFNRLTGVALAGVLYAAPLVYLLHPIYPVIDSAHLIAAVADLPSWLKTTGKLAIALPLTFHTFNGVRHLGWDLSMGLSMKSVYTSGYLVIAATVLSSIYLAFAL